MSFYLKGNQPEKKKIKQRQQLLTKMNRSGADLFKIGKFEQETAGQKNCENLIGSVEVPVGVAGPLQKMRLVDLGVQLKDNHSQTKKTQTLETIIFPLATTEGALVASVARGVKALNQAELVSAVVRKVGMTRAPVFKLASGVEAEKFKSWLETKFNQIKDSCEETSQHLTLLDFTSWTQGCAVFVRFRFDTDQAMGMNMVTIALKKAWAEVINQFPQVEMVSISGNMCVDKKPSAVNQILGRGYQVKAEVELSEVVLTKILKTNSECLFKTHYWKNLIGSNLAGSNAQNMHIANMIAAMFLATGQDMAHVAEAAQANTVLNQRDDGLSVAVELNNLNLGTVGGGTWLPSFSQARNLILNRQIKSKELAAVMAVASLAGEISGLAALSTRSLAQAHQKLGR